jgi:hypothetical protein
MIAEVRTPIGRPLLPEGVVLSARADAAEDPRDLYRVIVPAKKTLTLTLSADANLALELWSSDAATVWTEPAGASPPRIDPEKRRTSPR